MYIVLQVNKSLAWQEIAPQTKNHYQYLRRLTLTVNPIVFKLMVSKWRYHCHFCLQSKILRFGNTLFPDGKKKKKLLQSNGMKSVMTHLLQHIERPRFSAFRRDPASTNDAPSSRTSQGVTPENIGKICEI